MIKSAFVRQLNLQPGEVAAVRARLDAADDTPQPGITTPVLDLLGAFERHGSPAELPAPAKLVAVPVSALHAFGEALVDLRRQAVAGTASDTAAAGHTSIDLGLAQHALRGAVIAVKALAANTQATPLGMLNLERLEMAPAGLERGELIATIPLAPLEETAVSHKEWSVQSKEFTSIVTDSLENTSETGVTDNTELAQSTNSQAQHSNQFNITGTVSGGIPVINGSASSRFTSQDSTSQSASDSTKHATSLTKKASARAKQEHKITISTTTVTGTSETSTRNLKNPSQTESMRVDYFSLMRKWRVRLYRYGLRLTYDLVIPEPSAGLRKMHKELADYRAQIGPFHFDIPHSEITDKILTDQGETQPHHRVLAERYGAVVPDPPRLPAGPQINISDTPNYDDARIFTPDPLDIPDGYRIKKLTLWWNSASRTGDQYQVEFEVLGSSYREVVSYAERGPIDLTSDQYGNFMLHATGKVPISFRLASNRQTSIKVVADLDEIPTVEPDPGKPPVSTLVRERWQAEVWNILRDAAQSQYYERQQDVAAKAAALQDEIERVDTLTLRREESDEIMKGVLRFLLGPDFAFMPDAVVKALASAGVDTAHGIGFDDNALGLDATSWAAVRDHEDVIRFINQAIEWENVVTFLYSYFWDAPTSWNFVRRLQHPDANRQAFLRAGSARVVLTVRKGWEEQWVNFVEGGFENSTLPPNPQYLSIAKEIAAYDDRNYPGIPPANPGRSAVRLEDSVATTSTAAVAESSAPQSIKVDSSMGFLVGAQVVIDSVDKVDPADGRPAQETQVIAAIPDPFHIVVGRLDRAHDGTVTPFAVLQPGTKGALIAEWNEYTPSSGTDIEIGSNLGTTA